MKYMLTRKNVSRAYKVAYRVTIKCYVKNVIISLTSRGFAPQSEDLSKLFRHIETLSM